MDGKELVKQTLDQIPHANANAKRIVALVKGGLLASFYFIAEKRLERSNANEPHHSNHNETKVTIPFMPYLP